MLESEIALMLLYFFVAINIQRWNQPLTSIFLLEIKSLSPAFSKESEGT